MTRLLKSLTLRRLVQLNFRWANCPKSFGSGGFPHTFLTEVMMSFQKLTPFLLLVVAVLLAANLLRPLVTAQPAHAQSEGGQMQLSGTGANAWLVKGDTVYTI